MRVTHHRAQRAPPRSRGRQYTSPSRRAARDGPEAVGRAPRADEAPPRAPTEALPWPSHRATTSPACRVGGCISPSSVESSQVKSCHVKVGGCISPSSVEAPRGEEWQSEAIRGHQRPSDAIRHNQWYPAHLEKLDVAPQHCRCDRATLWHRT